MSRIYDAQNVIEVPGSGPSECRQARYTRRVTLHVLLGAVLGAASGLFMGYENGIAGGVASFPEFQARFFPGLVHKPSDTDAYCKYQDFMLELFISCVYLASAVGAVGGSFITPRWGRRATIGIGACCFLVGAALQGAAVHVSMLILGRLALGLGVGLNDQAGPQFLSEIAPYHLRAAFTNCFQLVVVTGILVAQLINYGVHNISWGWRLSLGLAAVPGAVVLLLALLLDDTPNGLAERGKSDEALRVLKKIRGSDDVAAEFDDIMDAAMVAMSTNQWRLLLTKRAYRPQLVLNTLIPALQMLTGINAIIFFSAQIFESMGKGQSDALQSTVVVGVVFVASTFIAIGLTDKLGRRPLFQSSGLVCMATMAAVGGLLATNMDPSGGVQSQAVARAIVACICIYIAAFGWGWGPLAWLAPAELTPLECRAAGTALAVVANHIVCFGVGLFFLSGLCAMKYGAFIFFAAWLAIMTVFIQLALPESRGVPIEEVQERLFETHWLWSRYAHTPEAAAEKMAARTASATASGISLARPPSVGLAKVV